MVTPEPKPQKAPWWAAALFITLLAPCGLVGLVLALLGVAMVKAQEWYAAPGPLILGVALVAYFVMGTTRILQGRLFEGMGPEQARGLHDAPDIQTDDDPCSPDEQKPG